MARIKKKEHENLTSSNIQKVINLLNPDSGKPITKKVACEILNISYNTKRLSTIIEEYQDRVEYTAKRKKENKGKPATDAEIAEAVTSYLQGDPVADIARYLFRSPSFVKIILEKVGVPSRAASTEDKYHTDFIPEECVSETFEEGEIVWSARYHSTATVGCELSKEYQKHKKGLLGMDYEAKYNSKCYQVHIMERTDSEGVGGFFAYELAYDLAKLTHLEKYGVNLNKI